MRLRRPSPPRFHWWGRRTLRHETNSRLGNSDVRRYDRLSPGSRPEYVIWTTFGEFQTDEVVPGVVRRHSYDLSPNPLRDILTDQTDPDLPGALSFLPQGDQSPTRAEVSELGSCRTELPSLPPTQAGQVSGGGVPKRAATISLRHFRTFGGNRRKPLPRVQTNSRSSRGKMRKRLAGAPCRRLSSRSPSRNKSCQSLAADRSITGAIITYYAYLALTD
jgi:hypothetical protein